MGVDKYCCGHRSSVAGCARSPQLCVDGWSRYLSVSGTQLNKQFIAIFFCIGQLLLILFSCEIWLVVSTVSVATSAKLLWLFCTVFIVCILLRQVIPSSVYSSVRDVVVSCSRRLEFKKIISRLISLGCSLSANPNITDLLQREHPKILSGIGVGYEKVAFGI